MPIATAEQYRAMLDGAAAGGYALAGVNVSSSLTLNAALRGFAEAGADGIVQVSTGGGEFLSGGTVKDMVAGARALQAFARVVAGRCPVLVALHTDHCPPDKLDGFLRPLLAESLERREQGEQPLFHSQMFDGSTLALEDNLRIADELLDQCARADVVLEVECGVVGGEEDGLRAEGPSERLYTTTEEQLRVAQVLGTGERGRYLLAATFGNVHGVYASGNVKLRPRVLADGQTALAEAHPGAPFRYVFHGGSGSSREEIREAVSYGVVKMNIDSDTQYAFTRAVAGHMFADYDGVLKVDGGMGQKKAYDPRSWGREAEAGDGDPGSRGVRAARIGGTERSAVSGNVAVIYAGELVAVADVFGEAAAHLAARVRVLRVSGDESDERAGGAARAGLCDLEWANGIAFGTSIGDGAPAPILMRFIASTEPLWSSGRLYDKAVTVFTDEPERFAPDSVLHPIYDALYQWGAVIIGPRAFELALDAHPTGFPSSPLPAARLKTARYRAARLTRLAGVLADERHRRERLEL